MSTILELNADQAKAEDEFVDFLLDPIEKEMRLIGEGGTGKSYLVSKLITRSFAIYKENCKLLGLEPEYNDYALTALTNKAAQELSDATGLDVSTLHSFLSLALKSNYTTGKTDLKRTSNWTIRDKLILFIDESFMMDSPLLDELRMATMNCKIIFVGDSMQLDPVDAVSSPIADLQVRTAELKIPVRNASNPDGSPAPSHLRDLCTLFRDNVANQIATDGRAPWPMIKLVPGYIDHVDDVGLRALLEGQFAVPNGRNAIAAFSNSRVNDYNNFLRGIRGQSHLLEKGERFISNDMYERNKFRIKNEQTVEIDDADPELTLIKLGDLDVPTQYVRITADPTRQIPVIIDRDFHKDAIRYTRKRAKDGHENWERYFRLKQDFADFRPRDASTVHKLQGASRDIVIVDLPNIGSCNFNIMTARMLYVALSRARYRVILYGNLPAKYGGIIF